MVCGNLVQASLVEKEPLYAEYHGQRQVDEESLSSQEKGDVRLLGCSCMHEARRRGDGSHFRRERLRGALGLGWTRLHEVVRKGHWVAPFRSWCKEEVVHSERLDEVGILMQNRVSCCRQACCRTVPVLDIPSQVDSDLEVC